MIMAENAKNVFLSDEDIIELFFSRNESAIEETDKKYGKLLFSIAYRFLNDYGECEECKNTAYLAVWNSIPPNRPRIYVAFISTLMRNVAIDRYKHLRSKKYIPSEFTVALDEINALQSDDDIEKHIESEELKRIINSFIKGLSAKNRFIFIERFYMAESVENIAKELKTGVSNVYKALERIKSSLKKELERNGVIM